MTVLSYILLGIAAIPWIYYVLVLYSTTQFFRKTRKEYPPNTDFTPPVSCLKPIRGLDVEAYENYASFCRQDYPDYEIVFCVDEGDPALPVLEKLIRDFPERRIRLLFGSGRDGINDKVARLVRLVNEAAARSAGDHRWGCSRPSGLSARDGFAFPRPESGLSDLSLHFHEEKSPFCRSFNPFR